MRYQTIKGEDFEIDPEDFDRVSKYRWRVNFGGGSGTHPSIRTTQDVGMALSRFLMSPIPPKMQVDHIDGDPFNNRKSNLRICTSRQNTFNKGKIRNKSGYKGVYYVAVTGRFKTGIRWDGKQLWAGYFATAEEAAAKYNELATKYHGEFARLNQL